MKSIVLVTRSDAGERMGGDIEQIKQIGRYMEKSSYKVIITANLEEVIHEADIIVLFNLTRIFDLFYNFELVRKHNKPFILFPIYWDLDKVIPKEARAGFKKFLYSINNKWLVNCLRLTKLIIKKPKVIKYVQSSWFTTNMKVRQVLETASYVCCNSYAEEKHLYNRFNINKEYVNSRVVLNGIDLEFIKSIVSNDSYKTSLPKEYYVCVGAIGPRKNQYNLIKASIKAGVCLVLIGPESQDTEYVNKVYNLAKGENIIFLGQLSPSETIFIIRNSKGYLQPSYIETPGLASLEAASMGIPTILSDVEPVREYFNQYTLYCNAGSVDSIYEMIMLLERGDGNFTKSDYFERYDWNNVLKIFKEITEKI